MNVRNADLDRDRDAIVALFREHLADHWDVACFDWLYARNPAGPARAWMTHENDDTHLRGVAAAFPRRAYRKGEELSCWCLADFVIHPALRSLGPALQLQKACLAPIESGEIAMCYDHPSRSMAAIYKRLGAPEYARETRYARPVRVAHRVAARVNVPVVGDLLGAGANLLLRAADAVMLGGSGGLSVRVTGDRFDERFDALDASLRGQLDLHLGRDAKYLNWRYRECPVRSYDVVTASRGDRLAGYAVVHESDELLVADELVWDREIAGANGPRALLAALVKVARQRGALSVSVPLSCSEGWTRDGILGAGLSERDSAPVIVHGKDGATEGIESWLITAGDRIG